MSTSLHPSSMSSVLELSDDLLVVIATFLPLSSVVAFAATSAATHLNVFSDQSIFEYFWRQQFKKHCDIPLPRPSADVIASPALMFRSLLQLLHSDVASVVPSLIASAVSETSSDNEAQTVRNTLTDNELFWSSTGHTARTPQSSSVSASEVDWSETLVYRLIFPSAVVTSVALTMYQCAYQLGLSIFAPTHVQFHVGYLQNDYHYSSERFPCECVATPQIFSIPCVPGQYVAVQMFDAYELQRSDGLYYQCVRHVVVNGLPLSLLKDDSTVTAQVSAGTTTGRRQLLDHFIRHGIDHGLIKATETLMEDERKAESERLREVAQDTQMLTIHDDDDDDDDGEELHDDYTETIVPTRFLGQHVNQPPTIEAFPIIHSAPPTPPNLAPYENELQEETEDSLSYRNIDTLMTDSKTDDISVVVSNDIAMLSILKQQLMESRQCELINQWFLAVHQTLYKQVKPLIELEDYTHAGLMMAALSTLNSVIYSSWSIHAPAVYHPRDKVCQWIYNKTNNFTLNRNQITSFLTHPLLLYLQPIGRIWTYTESFFIINILNNKFYHFITNYRHILLPLQVTLFCGDYLLSIGQIKMALDIYSKKFIWERIVLVYILLGKINEALSLSERSQFMNIDYLNILKLAIYYLLLWKNNHNIFINFTLEYIEITQYSIIQTAIILINSPTEFNCRHDQICMVMTPLLQDEQQSNNNNNNNLLYNNHTHSDTNCIALINRFYNESRLRVQRVRSQSLVGMETEVAGGQST